MQQIKLGRNGPTVSAFGLGCMGMSGGYGPADDKECIATIHAALEAGITMIDTGDFYGMGHNEMLIREALKGGKRERAFIAVKFGSMRGPDGRSSATTRGRKRPRIFSAYSLRRLGTDYVDLYQPSRVDPAGADRGHHRRHRRHGEGRLRAPYRRLGSLGQDDAARRRRCIRSRRCKSNIRCSRRGIEREILPTLRELGIALVAYGVLSGGLISDRAEAARTAASEMRTPQAAVLRREFAKNIALVEALGKIAREKGALDARSSPSPGSNRAATTSCR